MLTWRPSADTKAYAIGLLLALLALATLPWA